MTRTNLHPDGAPISIAEIVRRADIEDARYIPARDLANAAPALADALRAMVDVFDWARPFYAIEKAAIKKARAALDALESPQETAGLEDAS